MTAANPSIDAAREIVATRVFDAPREMVFQMWTDPTHISNWWGPRGFRTTVQAMDVRPGGIWRHVMHGPDGRDYPNEIVYLDVVKPERLAYRHISPPPFEMTVTFADRAGKTEVTARMVFESAALRERVAADHRAVEGLQQTLERLSEEIKNMSEPLDAQFEISRAFNAPRDLVWEALTEPSRLAHWWGPKGSKITTCNVDLRPGGTFHYAIAVPNGEMWGKWVYREIVRPERMVFVSSFSDAQGNITRSPFSVTWPLEVLNVATLTENRGKTTLTVRGGPIDATAEERATFHGARPSMEQGFNGTFDSLDEYLAANCEPGLRVEARGELEIVLTRVFDAPREMVFEAMTRSEHVVRWYGPRSWTLETCEMDLRPGGTWRHFMRGPGGRTLGMHGVYREIAAPERLVSTECMDGQPGETVITLTFVEQDGKTTFTNTVVCSSKELRDAILNSGMERGAGETYDRLAEMLAEWKAGG